MISKEEINKGIADLLRDIRVKRGLSKSRIADLLYMDDKTWSRYESGAGSPSVSDFIWIFAMLGENALPPVLRMIYPDNYGCVRAGSSTEEIRNAAVHYISEIATDRFIREWSFLCFESHGSNIEPQMQEFTMIDHLPMEYRIAVAELVMSLYRIAELKGELVNTDHIMPDVSLVEDGISKAKAAVMKGLDSYTTAMEGDLA